MANAFLFVGFRVLWRRVHKIRMDMTEKLKLKPKKLLSTIAMFICIVHCYGQATVTTAGGEAGTICYTVGQTIVMPVITDAGSLTPGVQQTYLITIADNVGLKDRQITLEAEVYPNPVTDRLILRVNNVDTGTMRYTLIDANGRTITSDNIANVQTTIDMCNLVPAVYFLRTSEGDTTLLTFKIVKK